MATVAIGTNKGLITDGYTLISAFNQNSIEFEFDRGVLTGTTAEVVLNGVHFEAFKSGTVGNVDTYYLDVTDKLPYFLGLSPQQVTVNGLTISLTAVCNGLNSSGSVEATASETVTLCYGIKELATSSGMTILQDNGSGYPIYHNGKICLWNNDVSGNYTIGIGGIDHVYALVHGFNVLLLDPAQRISGALTSGILDISVVYRPANDDNVEIAWINKDGRWSFWNFRPLSVEDETKWSNEINLYGKRNTDVNAVSRLITAETNQKLYFDTVAVDITHYQQLIDIAKSPSVVFNGLLMKVVDSSKRVSCRQNLNFKLTLQSEKYAVSY